MCVPCDVLVTPAHPTEKGCSGLYGNRKKCLSSSEEEKKSRVGQSHRNDMSVSFHCPDFTVTFFHSKSGNKFTFKKSQAGCSDLSAHLNFSKRQQKSDREVIKKTYLISHSWSDAFKSSASQPASQSERCPVYCRALTDSGW